MFSITLRACLSFLIGNFITIKIQTINLFFFRTFFLSLVMDKTSKITKKLFLLLIIFIFSGLENIIAQHEYFVTSPGNTMLFQKKKDLLFSIGGMQDKENTLTKNIETQLGYSLTDFLGISISHARYHVANSITQDVIYHKSYLSGIDVNFYRFLKMPSSRLPTSGIFANLSIGYSNGQMDNNHFIYDHTLEQPWRNKSSSTINLHKFHVQADLHWLIFNALQIGGGYRVGLVNYYSGVLHGSAFISSTDQSDLNLILRDNKTFFSEFSVAANFKFKNMGIYCHAVAGNVKSLGDEFVRMDIGLTFNLSAIKTNFVNRRKGKM